MNLLVFDGRFGASGDMILAALVDVGADPAVLEPVENALDVEYRIDRTRKCGINATTVDVLLTDDATDRSRVHDEDDDHDDRHRHTNNEDGHDDHDHDDHGHDDHGHDEAVRAEGHGPHRSYREVREIVERMDFEPAIERDALAIFELLGEAEASVHGTELEETHFHEVGADDAIADVVGAILLVADLDLDRVVTTPLSAGGGMVSMSHGEYPVPVPAVAEIAARADWTLASGPVERELLTPTGAAILAYLADGVDSLPPIEVASVGYGAGGYDLDPRPNVLRALVGQGTGGLRREDVALLETNLDDATPETLGSLQETLASVGARDVSVVPTTMKKSRPGHLVKVVCKPEDRRRVARKLAEETGTLGVRDAGVTHRWIADRRFETVDIEVDGEAYEVTVKVASDADGTVYDVSAEYDDTVAVASETGVPVREVRRRAEAAFDG